MIQAHVFQDAPCFPGCFPQFFQSFSFLPCPNSCKMFLNFFPVGYLALFPHLPAFSAGFPTLTPIFPGFSPMFPGFPCFHVFPPFSKVFPALSSLTRRPPRPPHLGDVQAARCDVGGDQKGALATGGLWFCWGKSTRKPWVLTWNLPKKHGWLRSKGKNHRDFWPPYFMDSNGVIGFYH